MMRRLLIISAAAAVALALTIQDAPGWALAALAVLAWGVLAGCILRDFRKGRRA